MESNRREGLVFDKQERIQQLFYSLSLGISTIFLIFDLIYNQDSRYLHLIFIALFVLISWLKPTFGWGLTLASLCWFEQPLLLLQFPNQFLSDLVLLVNMWMSHLRQPRFVRKPLLIFTSHPLILPLLFVLLVVTGQFIGSLGEWWQSSRFGFDVTGLPSLIGRKVWIWDISENPLHNLSVWNGYLIQITFIYFAINKFPLIFKSHKEWLFYFLMGAFVVFIYALMQRLFPQIISHRYSLDLGATLQNGNHLSYFSGLVALMACLGQTSWNTISSRIFSNRCFAAILSLSLICLFLGKGRTAVLSLLLAVFTAAGIFLSFFPKRNLFFLKKNPYLLLLFVAASSLLVGIAYIYWRVEDPSSLLELELVIKDFSFARLLAMGGRWENYTQAWYALQSNWLLGIGEGSFLRRSEIPYDIHNQFLNWMVGNGIFSGVILFLTLGQFLLQLCKIQRINSSFRAQDFWSLSLFFYIVFCLLPDCYISYRSLLTGTSLAFVLIASAYQPNFNRLASPLKQKYRIAANMIIGGCIAIFSILNPSSNISPLSAYKSEINSEAPGGSLQWQSYGIRIDLAFKQCWHAYIYPLFPSGATIFYIAPIPGYLLANKYLSRQRYYEFAKHLLLEPLVLENGKWQSVCICHDQRDHKASHVLFYTDKAEFLSLSKSQLVPDDRLIAFGMSRSQLAAKDNLPSAIRGGCRSLDF